MCSKRVRGWGCWVRQALQRPGIAVCRLDTHRTSEAIASPQVRSQALHVEGRLAHHIVEKGVGSESSPPEDGSVCGKDKP